MYKDILRDIDNIAIWPTISFVIFFLFNPDGNGALNSNEL